MSERAGKNTAIVAYFAGNCRLLAGMRQRRLEGLILRQLQNQLQVSVRILF